MAFNPLNQIKSVVGGNLVKVAGNLPSAIASRVLGGSNSSNLSNVFNGVTRGTKKNTKVVKDSYVLQTMRYLELLKECKKSGNKKQKVI